MDNSNHPKENNQSDHSSLNSNPQNPQKSHDSAAVKVQNQAMVSKLKNILEKKNEIAKVIDAQSELSNRLQEYQRNRRKKYLESLTKENQEMHKRLLNQNAHYVAKEFVELYEKKKIISNTILGRKRASLFESTSPSAFKRSESISYRNPPQLVFPSLEVERWKLHDGFNTTFNAFNANKIQNDGEPRRKVTINSNKPDKAKVFKSTISDNFAKSYSKEIRLRPIGYFDEVINRYSNGRRNIAPGNKRRKSPKSADLSLEYKLLKPEKGLSENHKKFHDNDSFDFSTLNKKRIIETVSLIKRGIKIENENYLAEIEKSPELYSIKLVGLTSDAHYVINYDNKSGEKLFRKVNFDWEYVLSKILINKSSILLYLKRKEYMAHLSNKSEAFRNKAEMEVEKIHKLENLLADCNGEKRVRPLSQNPHRKKFKNPQKSSTNPKPKMEINPIATNLEPFNSNSAKDVTEEKRSVSVSAPKRVQIVDKIEVLE